jgi:hypothetical protein
MLMPHGTNNFYESEDEAYGRGDASAVIEKQEMLAYFI